MPRKATVKKIEIVGPVVKVDGEEMVGFTTNFSGYGFSKLRMEDLQHRALESHQAFMDGLSDLVASMEEVPEKKASPAKETK